MGLQVRLRHALGERVLELPSKPVDDPVVVGRAADADVQVPSVNVGSRHAVLFVHDDHWVVQDVSSSHPTYVNGEPLSGPRPLYSGDVVVLGTDANAPMIEVDPDGVTLAHAEPAAGSAVAAAPFNGAYPSPTGSMPAVPAPPAYVAPPSRMVTTGVRAPQAAGMYVAPAPYDTVEHPHAQPHDPHADEEAAWTAAAAGATRRRRRQPKTSEAAIGVAVLVAVGVIGTVSYLVYQRRQEAEVAAGVNRVEPVKTAPAPAPEPAMKRVPKSIFSEDGPAPAAPSTTPPKASPTPNRNKPAPPPDLTDAQPPGDPGDAPPQPDEKVTAPAPAEGGGKASPASKAGGGADDTVISESDPTFKRVENAYYSPDPAKALLTFDAYEEEFPNKHTPRIEEYREAMLDKIWWDRIESLFEKRQALTQGIKETQLAIKEETEEAHKKTVLEPRLEEQKSRLASLGEKLTKEMGYRATTPPPITDEAAMAELRAKRDKALYEPWKKRVLKHIRDKHGDYPWANEK